MVQFLLLLVQIVCLIFLCKHATSVQHDDSVDVKSKKIHKMITWMVITAFVGALVGIAGYYQI